MLLALAIFATILLFLLRRYYGGVIQHKDRALQDLTAELSLQKQQSFHEKNELNAILSSMVEGVLVIGRDEKILYVSPNASSMFQMRSKDVALKPYWEVIPHQQINQSIKEALQHKRAVNKEIYLLGAQDNFFSLQISPVVQQGQLTSAVAVFHDITELKRLLKMRTEFVANVSHELKTPLTSIKGFVETLQEEGGARDARRFLDIIHKQTLRLEMLVNDLLTISAIESREAKMDLAPQDIAAVVHAVLAMNKKAIEAAKHQVMVNIPDHIPAILADRNHLEQVFINLLDNAVKFTPAGGRIQIKAVVEPPFVRIDVQDSGIGIAQEHLSRVFERFYRVDKARSTETGGTGLGLAIVKHIVQAHQGKVEVHSTPDKGTVFSIFLPPAK